MKYRLGHSPSRMQPHNEVTWNKLVSVLEKGGGVATYEELCSAARGHRSGTKSDHALTPQRIAERFVDYCARPANSWIVEVQV
jgi:hypothetical protein